MHIICEPFTYAKDGCTDAQNDDAHYPLKQIEATGEEVFRCAVADGATESLFAGKWADRLARAFARGRLSQEKAPRSLASLERLWAHFLNTRQLNWYAQGKVETGSYATLIGLELLSSTQSQSGRPEWSATAVGDSCLFIIRNGSLSKCLPLNSSDQFNNRPHLIYSNPSLNSHFDEWVIREKGDLYLNDTFYLLTDALAYWFLRDSERGRRPWDLLEREFQYGTSPTFEQWVQILRDDDPRLNDDATMLRIKILSTE